MVIVLNSNSLALQSLSLQVRHMNIHYMRSENIYSCICGKFIYYYEH
jgi:hypothetical protein